MKGRINSFQTMGAVDGPGVRFVIFMQGCPLRCVYCHNPETWEIEKQDNENYGLSSKDPAIYSIDEVLEKIKRFKPYFGQKGGVTVSGGEPLLQWEFVFALFKKLKEEGIHTALDTSGIGNLNGARQLLEYTDLVLCDLKFSSEEDYMKYCKGSLKAVLEFLNLTEKASTDLWVRHVVVPEINDNVESVKTISKIAKSHSNFKRLELLPFRKLCTSKYENMGIEFPLKDTAECPEVLIKELYEKLL